MKKIALLGLLAIGLSGCSDEDNCQCEVYKNKGTQDDPVLEYFGKYEGRCEDQTFDFDFEYIIQNINCE